MDEPIFDLQAALASVDGRLDILIELARTFLQHAPKLVSTLVAAVEQRDAVATADAAHALRGTVGYFGATGVILDLERLEGLASERNLSEVDRVSTAVQVDIDRLTAHLRELVDGPPAPGAS